MERAPARREARWRGLTLAAALAAATAGCAEAGTTRPAGGASVAETPSPPAGEAARLRVAAAADLRYAMDELVAAWAAERPEARVDVAYGSSGTFFAQIAEGAPFDVYFSADVAYPRRLEASGQAAPGATRLYAIGQIVVWAPAESGLDVEGRGLQALADPAARAVAIANPEHAPYGRAAVAALKSAGIYAQVAPKLVLGENVAQAAQFVDSGNADVGVIALSLALAPGMRDRGRHAVVPLEAYPRLEQGAVVLGSAEDPALAEAFLDHVLGPAGREVLNRYGFLLPAP